MAAPERTRELFRNTTPARGPEPLDGLQPSRNVGFIAGFFRSGRRKGWTVGSIPTVSIGSASGGRAGSVGPRASHGGVERSKVELKRRPAHMHRQVAQPLRARLDRTCSPLVDEHGQPRAQLVPIPVDPYPP